MRLPASLVGSGKECDWGSQLLRVLTYSSLYPNMAQPNHGVFVENRLLQTCGLGAVAATVVAPVPYFPAGNPIFGAYSVYGRVPRYERRNGLEVFHPRYPVIPKIGMHLTPRSMWAASLRTIQGLIRRGYDFDVIDAHYFYPDGVAAINLGRALRRPVVITGRGTDLTLIPCDRGARKRIEAAIAKASVTIAVCEDLRERLLSLGAPPDRCVTLRNGVDLVRFSPGDRAAARNGLGVRGFVLASVGSLIPRKGHELVIEAVADLPDCELLIAGQGPLRRTLERLAADLGIAERVHFLGEVRHDVLADVYRAADVLVLASSREGWANVLLEAMACGTPVIATDVNGTCEVVRDSVAGRLLQIRDPSALRAELTSLRRAMPNRDAVRRYAEQFGWRDVALANRTILSAAAAAGFGAPVDVGVIATAHKGMAVESALGRSVADVARA